MYNNNDINSKYGQLNKQQSQQQQQQTSSYRILNTGATLIRTNELNNSNSQLLQQPQHYNHYPQTNLLMSKPRPLPPSNKASSSSSSYTSSNSNSSNNNGRYSNSSNYSQNLLPDINKKTANKVTSSSNLLYANRTRSPSVGAAYMQPQQQRLVVNQMNDLNLNSNKTYLSNESSSSSSVPQSHSNITNNQYYTTSARSSSSNGFNNTNNNNNNNEDDQLERNGIVGLKNIGNTCFMNSILQCLNNSKLLIQYCLKNKYEDDLNTTLSRMKGSLFKSYAQLIHSMWSKRDGSVTPQDFKSKIAFYAPRFVGYSQQDAQEFLRYLLIGLHEDVNLVRSKPKPIKYDEQAEDKMTDSEKSEYYWENYLHFDRSKIVDIFVGQLKSVLTCTVCDYKSVTFDPFWDLSLPIPTGSFSTVTLFDCLKLFMAEEILDGDEKPTCARCKQRRKCTKRFSIQKLPENLVLHLKRFSPQHRRKLETNVQYPISDLDMRKYLSDTDISASYELYGISFHSGSQSFGHYVASCKHPFSKKWYHYDDSTVSEISPNRLQSSQAYVLFYEKVK